MKKWFALLALLIMLVTLVVTFKTTALRVCSNFLICEDAPEKSDAMVVLSGDAFMRGHEGARLYQQGFAPLVICPGGNIEHNLLIVTGDSIYESELCRRKIIGEGVDSNHVVALHEGTSTAEEAEAVLQYCKQKQIHQLLVVTSKFHTRRARNVYKKKFAAEGITVRLRGSSSVFFDENFWWTNEYGMLALNNEYVKLLFYALK